MTDSIDTGATPKGRGPGLVRVSIVAGAALSLLITAAATLAASPAPSTGTQSAQPSAGGTWSRNAIEQPGDGWGTDGPFGHRGMGGGFGGPGFGQITIAAIDGSNLALTTEDGWSRTIAVASSTTISKDGQSIGMADLAVGDEIRFRQTRASDGAYTIDAIEVVAPHVSGTVGAITASGFTINGRDGTTWAVTVSGSTTYTLGGTAGSLADVTVGAQVSVSGTKDSATTFKASSVVVEPVHTAGEVTAKDASTITVQQRDGSPATIRVDSSTSYQVAGVTEASLADITVGMQIMAQGSLSADGSLNASSVMGGSLPGRGFGGPMGPWHGQQAAPSTSPAAGSQG